MKLKTLALIAVLLTPTTAPAWTLTWNHSDAPGAFAAGMRIYRKAVGGTTFEPLIDLSATTRFFTDPPREVGICYRVVAFNNIGESAPAEACARVPAVVTNLVLE